MKRQIKKHQSGMNAVNGLLFGPRSDWLPPSQFPCLTGVKKLGLDVETKDPLLLERGPGEIRGDGFVCGISVATHDASWYFPIAHLDGGNMDRGPVIDFLRDNLKDPDCWYLTANGQYDMGWLGTLGIEPRGRFLDVQLAEALIDEEQESYALDALCSKYGLVGKDENLLKQAGLAYGSSNVKGDLWKFHSRYVGPYAEFDTRCLFPIFDAQVKEMQTQDLMSVFQLECRLMSIVYQMRKRGVRVDWDAAEKFSKDLVTQEEVLRNKLKVEVGFDVDVWSGLDLARVCESKNIYFPRTDKGNPSFVKEWLDEHEHPMMEMVTDIREMSRLRTVFLDDWIIKNMVRDRIHPNWKQTRTEEGGTRSGRFSANKPNPQQFPAAQTRRGVPRPLGAQFRSLFIAEEGCEWGKGDWSQQEPRILTHYAALTNKTGAKLAEMAFIKNPELDFYQFMMDASGSNRRTAKDNFLGRAYGMGTKKMAARMNMTIEQSQAALKQVDDAVPFIKEMADACMSLASRRGFIKTIAGRKCHFDYYEPVDSYQLNQAGVDTRPVRGESRAKSKWPGKLLRRAQTHKALNRLIQGSAADLMKTAIVRCYEEHGWYPYLTVHDELDGPISCEDDARKVLDIMRSPVESIKIPMKVEWSVGKSWK